MLVLEITPSSSHRSRAVAMAAVLRHFSEWATGNLKGLYQPHIFLASSKCLQQYKRAPYCRGVVRGLQIGCSDTKHFVQRRHTKAPSYILYAADGSRSIFTTLWRVQQTQPRRIQVSLLLHVWLVGISLFTQHIWLIWACTHGCVSDMSI